MHDLKKTFEEYAEAYNTLWAAVKNTETSPSFKKVYACHDAYSLEPYYQELNNLSDKKMRIFENKDSLPKGADVYEYFKNDNLVIYSRHTDSVNMVMDSFFLYIENEIWKYDYYVSSGNNNLAGVQYLKRDKNNNPISLKYYNKYGAYENHYEHNTADTIITTSSTSASCDSRTKVVFNQDHSEIIKIELITDIGNVSLYTSRKNHTNEKKLLKKAKKIIVDTTIGTLKEQNVIDKEIAFILFDYDFDNPFCPAVGLCQTEERKNLTAAFGPLGAYGTPEMEYFSEHQNPGFPFFSKTGSREVIEELTKLVDYNHEYEEKKQLIVDTYVDICKELMAHGEITKYINVASDFHIVANDFSERNVKTYLKALLPKTQLRALKIAT